MFFLGRHCVFETSTCVLRGYCCKTCIITTAYYKNMIVTLRYPGNTRISKYRAITTADEEKNSGFFKL